MKISYSTCFNILYLCSHKKTVIVSCRANVPILNPCIGPYIDLYWTYYYNYKYLIIRKSVKKMKG